MKMELFERYLNNDCNANEVEVVISWLKEPLNSELLKRIVKNTDRTGDSIVVSDKAQFVNQEDIVFADGDDKVIGLTIGLLLFLLAGIVISGLVLYF